MFWTPLYCRLLSDIRCFWLPNSIQKQSTKCLIRSSVGNRPSVSGWHLHLYQVLPFTESSGPSLEWVLGAQRGIAVIPSLSCGLRPGCILSLGDREDWVYISTSFPSFSFLSAHLYLLCARSPQIQSLSDSIFSDPKPSLSCLEGGRAFINLHQLVEGILGYIYLIM